MTPLGTLQPQTPTDEKVNTVYPFEVELDGEQLGYVALIEKVALELPDAFVAVTVYVVEAEVAVAVPEINPEEVSKVKPETENDGEIE